MHCRAPVSSVRSPPRPVAAGLGQARPMADLPVQAGQIVVVWKPMLAGLPPLMTIVVPSDSVNELAEPPR